jgi:hypothetical protein
MTFDSRHDRLWIPVLMLAAILGSFAFACAAPFAALAAMLALTTQARRGLPLIVAAWALNQAIGYGALDYPRTADSFIWGAGIGLAALAATAAAYAVMPRLSARPLAARAVLSFLAAFVVLELALLAVGIALGDTAAFAPAIVAEVGLVNVLWFAALVAAHALLGASVRRAAAHG